MFKKILVLLAIAAVAIQFIRPDRSNPKVNPAQDLAAVANPPAEVQAILKNRLQANGEQEGGAGHEGKTEHEAENDAD